MCRSDDNEERSHLETLDTTVFIFVQQVLLMSVIEQLTTSSYLHLLTLEMMSVNSISSLLQMHKKQLSLTEVVRWPDKHLGIVKNVLRNGCQLNVFLTRSNQTKTTRTRTRTRKTTRTTTTTLTMTKNIIYILCHWLRFANHFQHDIKWNIK